jgi:hypothetical protein
MEIPDGLGIISICFLILQALTRGTKTRKNLYLFGQGHISASVLGSEAYYLKIILTDLCTQLLSPHSI